MSNDQTANDYKKVLQTLRESQDELNRAQLEIDLSGAEIHYVERLMSDLVPEEAYDRLQAINKNPLLDYCDLTSFALDYLNAKRKADKIVEVAEMCKILKRHQGGVSAGAFTGT